MPSRIREDPPSGGVDTEQRGTESKDLFMGPVDVFDIEIQMELLRMRLVRPPRARYPATR